MMNQCYLNPLIPSHSYIHINFKKFKPVQKMAAFKRSLDSNFPIKWHEFTSKSGKKYTIQDIPDEYKDVLVHHLVYGLTRDEPLLKYGLAATFPSVLTRALKHWKDTVYKNFSLVCLTTNEYGEIQIAGASCLDIASEDEQKEYAKDDKHSTDKIIATNDYMTQMGDAFKKLGVNRYLFGLGLYALPEFRGEGIGIELLKAREPLCKHLGIKATSTIFTSKYSQNSALKVGFKDLYSIRYEDLVKINEKLVFPGIENHSEWIRNMYKVYD